MLSTINLDLINPDAAAPGEWIEIYKGAGNCLCSEDTESGTDEYDEECNVTISIKMDDGKPILICLAPCNAELPQNIAADLYILGWSIDENTWHQPSSEDCLVAQLGELGDRLESAPYVIEWEESSAWRFESVNGPRIYDHQDPDIDPDDLKVLTQYAFYSILKSRSQEHERIACKLMVPANRLEAAKALLLQEGVTRFSTKEVEAEQTPFFVVDDAGYGAIAHYTGKDWIWEQYK